MNYDLIVVGSGFFGVTVAREAAEKLGLKVLILEKRDHIGGNAYSYFEPDLGIEVHKYGSHLFHTSNERIWDYVNRFTKFTNYKHRVFTNHANQIYSMPINLATISQFYGRSFTPSEARELILSESFGVSDSESNLEAKAICSIGAALYEAFVKNYTLKQWEEKPSKLPAEVISRLPVRYNFNNDYFSDKYQGLPVDGYFRWFDRLVDHEKIDIQMNTDFLKTKNDYVNSVPVVYTGPIDAYFAYEFGHLNWRTLELEFEILPVEDFQGTSVMNYADLDFPYTRIHEFKHLHPERKYEQMGTIIAKEYSRMAKRADEPYYPVNLERDKAILAKYKELSELEKSVWFGGRLGSYKYLDMHMAIGAALTLFENEIKPFFRRKF